MWVNLCRAHAAAVGALGAGNGRAARAPSPEASVQVTTFSPTMGWSSWAVLGSAASRTSPLAPPPSLAVKGQIIGLTGE